MKGNLEKAGVLYEQLPTTFGYFSRTRSRIVAAAYAALPGLLVQSVNLLKAILHVQLC
jgi:hypothetical protein